MTDHVGWRKFWWLNVGMLTIVFILLIFFFPETKWHRLHPSEIAQTAASSAEKVATPAFKSDDPEDVTSSFPEDSPPLTTTITGYDPVLGQGKPSKQQFMPYQSHPAPFKTLLKEFIVPWRIMAFPIVEFAAFVVSWSASSFLTINLTQAQNFAAPPYNFSSQAVGFTNFALLVGSLLGLATNGRLSDWIAARATRKNRGIREPEMRLSTLIPYVCIMLLGNFVVAFGYQHKWDWKVRNIIFTCSLFPDPILSSLSSYLSSLVCSSLINLPLILASPDHRNHWLHLRRHPSRRHPRHRLHLRN